MKTETICRDVPCDRIIAERPRYYARQLITPDDLTLEQDYFRDKLRRHNRLLHGWGVVCGALVCPAPKADRKRANEFEPWKVMVKPGYILGPYGDEINLDCCRTVDLRTQGVTGITGEPCVEAPDPWCSEVFEPREAGDSYVAVRYREVRTRPVRVQPVGCGCDDTHCEYSRWRDGYEIGILTHCSDSHANPPRVEDLFKGSIPSCPPCPEEPWVVLAKVTIGTNGEVTNIDNCVCRRMVAAYGHFWWKCEGGFIRITGVDPQEVQQEQKNVEIKISGENFLSEATVSFGSGVNVKQVEVQPDHRAIVVTVDIDHDAGPGPRALTVVNPDCSTATKAEAITIMPREETHTTAQPTEGRRPAERSVEERRPPRRGRRRGEEESTE